MANFVLPEVSFQLMQSFVCYRRVPPSRLRATTAGVLGTVWKVGWAPANAVTLKGKGERGGRLLVVMPRDESENLKTPKQGVWWFRVSFDDSAGCVFILLHAWCAPSDPQRGHGQASQPPAGRARSAER